MARAKTVKKTQPITNAGSPAATPIAAFESAAPVGMEERIRERAYALFLERSGQNGCPEEDWLRAEAEVLGHSGRRTA